MGRKSIYTPEQQEQIATLYEAGESVFDLIIRFGGSKMAILYNLRKRGVRVRRPGTKVLITKLPNRPPYRIVVGNERKTFQSFRDMGNFFGITREKARRRYMERFYERWFEKTYQKHPGLDCIPAPYPFFSFSKSDPDTKTHFIWRKARENQRKNLLEEEKTLYL